MKNNGDFRISKEFEISLKKVTILLLIITEKANNSK